MKAYKSYIDNNGKLAIPNKIRKYLHLKVGDEVTIKYSESELNSGPKGSKTTKKVKKPIFDRVFWVKKWVLKINK